MRRALVVFESMFGNTQQIAGAVAKGLSSSLPTVILEVGAAPTVLPDDVDLLLVGGPTHAFGLSRTGTRENAIRQAGGRVVSEGIGLREWLAALARTGGGVAVAAFDTRIAKPRVPGSAARAAEKCLRKLGFRVVAASESFYVAGTAGPLVEGETERARAWGEKLGQDVRVVQHQRTRQQAQATETRKGRVKTTSTLQLPR